MKIVRHMFRPSYERLAYLPGLRTVEELHSEPMLFSASPAFAYTHGGPITKEVLEFFKRSVRLVVEPGLQIVIDTRTHMLMKGMLPAIPGWHCDGLVRPERYAQPLLESYDPRVRHYAIFFATEPRVSRTVFCKDARTLEVDPDRVWGSVDQSLQATEKWLSRDGDDAKTRFFYEQTEGELMSFDEQTLHRASPCEVPGWRMFFRLSVTRDPVRDQIRKQTQVYTTSSKGW